MTHFFTPDNFEASRFDCHKISVEEAKDGTKFKRLKFFYRYPTPDGDVEAEPMLRLVDLESKRGITASGDPRYFGKASIGVTVDPSDSNHVKIFGDADHIEGTEDGILKRIRMRVIELFYEHGGPSYPKVGKNKMSPEDLSANFKLFAAHMKFPPTQEEIEEDTTGALAKKKKECNKFFKIKYIQSRPDNVEPELVEDMIRQKTQGLKMGEVPVGCFTPTKFFKAVENGDGSSKIKTEEIRDFTSLIMKSFKFVAYVKYPSLYIGNLFALEENLFQVMIWEVSEATSGVGFIDSHAKIEELTLNTEQKLRSMMANSVDEGEEYNSMA